jgi:hypothetical protein
MGEHMLRAAQIALVLTLLSSCTMVRYNAPSLDDHKRGSAQTIRSLGYLWGIIPPNKVSLETCGSPGIKSMKINQGFIDWLITNATLGIVVSYKVKVICAESLKR